MAMPPEEKARRARQRMLDKAREYQTGTYINRFVASEFQRMIRAEQAASSPGYPVAVVDGKVVGVFRQRGECVCVTCGKTGPWKGDAFGGGEIETGHFLASRRASIVLEEHNAHPQCKHCNRHLSGNQANYEMWMQHVYGQDEVDRLRRLKTETRQFTREELVDRLIEYRERLKAAEERMR